MKKVLFISPHADDAILSCGSYIAALADTGCEVFIATVFTSAGANASATSKELYCQRKTDDINAAAVLGAKAIHLDFTDAPHRNDAYHNFSTLLFHHRLPSMELSQVAAISNSVNELIAEIQPAQVFFPLGVGGHIDHQIVFESSRSQEDHSGYTILYYEEQPYNLVPSWNNIRWQQLGAKATTVAGPLPSPRPLHSLPLAFVQNYMYKGSDTAESMSLYNKEVAGLPAFALQPTGWQLYTRHYEYIPLVTAEHYFQKKCKAISEYTTEWQALFGKSTVLIQETLAADLHENSYLERCWTINDNL